ncbi:hypothetical protein [Sphingomonas sp. ID0503]|uniref:hypothetical protein n=1 Tax=Sphingomonas sp. ID0503 TaxID=3399691 RepID=UPI003AFA95B1
MRSRPMPRSALQLRHSAPVMPARAAPLALVVSNEPAALTDLERCVVVLSRRDRPVPGKLAEKAQRIARTLFGTRPANTLADPRLEALRRFAISLRLGDGMAGESETVRFLSAGFRREQIETIFRLCRERSARRLTMASRRRQVMLAVAVWAGILPPFAVGLSDYFEDEMIGLVCATLLFAVVAPITGRFRSA